MLSNEVCSNYINPLGLLYAIFCLTDFSSDLLEVSSTEMRCRGSAQ